MIKAKLVSSAELQPGDLFSYCSPGYWDQFEEFMSVAEKVYIRTFAPTPTDESVPVYKITIERLTCDICDEASADVTQSGALCMCEKCEREAGDEYYEGYPDDSATTDKTVIDCARCGEPVHLDNIHPDSLSIPDDDNWHAVHGSDDVCDIDRRAWIWIVHTVGQTTIKTKEVS